MKGQIFTFDVLFGFFILVFTILFLQLIDADVSMLEELALERKATDFVRFLYVEKMGELALGVEVGGLDEGDLREGIGKVGASGVEFEDGGIVWGAGEREGRFRRKYLLAPVFNSSEVRVVRIDVW